MKQDEQLDEWVKGNSIHDDELDECCPDFSCCNKNVKTSLEVRQKFAEAYRNNDTETVEKYLMMFLGNAISMITEEKEVYIAGENPIYKSIH